MNNQILNEMKENYEKKISAKKAFQELLNKKEQLEENEFVKEYLKVCQELEKSFINQRLLNAEDKNILQTIINQYARRIKETNKIYVYLGTYYDSIETDIIHGSRRYRVERNNEKAEYSSYKDIENEEEIEITIDKCNEFEKKNKVIFPDTYFTSEYYYNLQRQFFEDTINLGQEEAVSKVLTKAKKQ